MLSKRNQQAVDNLSLTEAKLHIHTTLDHRLTLAPFGVAVMKVLLELERREKLNA